MDKCQCLINGKCFYGGQCGVYCPCGYEICKATCEYEKEDDTHTMNGNGVSWHDFINVPVRI